MTNPFLCVAASFSTPSCIPSLTSHFSHLQTSPSLISHSPPFLSLSFLLPSLPSPPLPSPQPGPQPDLLGTSGDYLRIWKVSDGEARLECMLNNVRTGCTTGMVVGVRCVRVTCSISTNMDKHVYVHTDTQLHMHHSQIHRTYIQHAHQKHHIHRHSHTHTHSIHTHAHTHTHTQHTHTHTHPRCLHSMVLVEQGIGTGQGEVGCGLESMPGLSGQKR